MLLSLDFSSSSSLPFVHETINIKMIVFRTAVFTRPPEHEVVQVPEEKKLATRTSTLIIVTRRLPPV